jgi:uncharacterized protein YbcI
MSFANRQVSHDDLEGLIVAEPPSAPPTLNAQPSTIVGGAVRNHLSTALVKLYREIFGRGPVKTATYAFDAGYVTFLREVLAPHERVLVLGGRPDLVCETRMAIRTAERERLIAEVQRLTGRPVLHDSFQFQPERDLAIELFWMPTGSEDGAGNSQASHAIAPTGSRHRGVISERGR